MLIFILTLAGSQYGSVFSGCVGASEMYGSNAEIGYSSSELFPVVTLSSKLIKSGTDGKFVVSIGETIDRRAIVVWDDDGYEDLRPSEVTVTLLKNQKVYETVTLSAANNWRYSWTGISAEYQWD